MSLMIARLGNSAPVVFAAEELRRYLEMMDPTQDISILAADQYDLQRRPMLWVGEDAAFEGLLPKVEERALDDGICIDVSGGVGIVTGTNARSVLLAAYRLLRENGCAFLNPGKDGERIPKRPLSGIGAKVCEAAQNRHRGVCIEGAVGYGHVLNMIDYLPKLGMNSYFIQFFVPRTFFDRWYSHKYNPTYPDAAISVTRDEVVEMQRSLVEQIKRRGMLLHMVGHGWTCEPFGIEGDQWVPQKEALPEEAQAMLAEVNGKRELWGGVALNTNLCYGNPKARGAVVEAIADYCAANPHVDYLHFWLADGTNNHCECPLCRDTAPSDFYVQMLNELDALMTARGIDTKVVFLIYVDLLWEPQTQRIKNPDRFTLMFAPITRTYTVPFLPDQPFEGELAPYKRNQNVMPQSVAENVARLRKWQEGFDGDAFDFDYHFMWDHLKDLGYYRMAEILMKDMQNLKKLGINGMISCQNQRVFFPTALGMHAMATGLWDRGAGFEALAEAYFDEAYGESGPAVRAYLKEVSEKYDPPYLRNEKPVVSEEQAHTYEELDKLVGNFQPVIDEHLASETDPVRAKEWRILQLHAKLVKRMAKLLTLCAKGDFPAAREAWKEAQSYACGIEPETHERFDLFEFTITYNRILKAFGVLE